MSDTKPDPDCKPPDTEAYLKQRKISIAEIFTQKNDKLRALSKKLSQFDSHQLYVIASYLRNEGKSSLSQMERGEAMVLLKEELKAIGKGDKWPG